MYRRPPGRMYSDTHGLGIRGGWIWGFAWGYSPEGGKVRFPVTPTMSLQIVGFLGVAGWSTA